MSNIAIFASGNGSNAEQIILYLKQHNRDIDISSIYTNKLEAGIHQVAKRHNISIHTFDNKAFEETEKVLNKLRDEKIEWIVLAGFLRKVESPIVKVFNNRIINIHPSLLPKFGGKGMYGSRVHKVVIEADEAESRISIHLVNDEFDKGKILFQAKCSIEKGQTVEELSKKIQNLEHRYFPEVIVNTVLKNRRSNENRIHQ